MLHIFSTLPAGTEKLNLNQLLGLYAQGYRLEDLADLSASLGPDIPEEILEALKTLKSALDEVSDLLSTSQLEEIPEYRHI